MRFYFDLIYQTKQWFEKMREFPAWRRLWSFLFPLLLSTVLRKQPRRPPCCAGGFLLRHERILQGSQSRGERRHFKHMKGWTAGTGSFLQPPKSVPRVDTAGVSVWIPPAFTITNWCNVFVPLVLDLWALSGNFEFSSTKKEDSEDNGSKAEESTGIVCAWEGQGRAY